MTTHSLNERLASALSAAADGTESNIIYVNGQFKWREIMNDTESEESVEEGQVFET